MAWLVTLLASAGCGRVGYDLAVEVDGGATDAGDPVAALDAPTGVAVDITAQVSTVAGDGTAGFADGDADGARFSRPEGIAVDGDGAEARFNEPSSAAIDDAGNLLVCEEQGHRIRRIVGGGPGRLGIRWDPVVDDDGVPARHYRATATAPGAPTRGCEARFGGTTCTVAGLARGTAYTVVVAALDAAGVAGPGSDPVVATAP